MAASKNPLVDLRSLGQSVWMDNINRKLLTTGELKRLIDEDGLLGMTSNPTIFEKAIGHGTDYDDDFSRIVINGGDAGEVYEQLTVADIRSALDIFRPVYEKTGGGDGYVSLEVSPLLAHDTRETLNEARKLWRLLDRPNAMIKIPGTPEGIPAVEEALFEGINVNITLLFSIDAYKAVARAYLRALERRVHAGLPVHNIASVASFFVSRIDTEVDKRLEAALNETSDPVRRAEIEGLFGKAAIANAKNAYTLYQSLFEGPDFAALKAKGARVQRLLWASVGTKNPNYPDTIYVDGLIGPETVSTMPPATIDAYRDHGDPRVTLTERVQEATEVMKRLGLVGIKFTEVTDKLVREGVESFAKSFQGLMATVREKRERLLKG